MKKLLEEHPYRWISLLVMCIVLSIGFSQVASYRNQILSNRTVALTISLTMMVTGGFFMLVSDRIQARFRFILLDSGMFMTTLGSYLLFNVVFP